MKKVWERGLALLLCLVLSSPMAAFASENQETSTDKGAESIAEVTEDDPLNPDSGKDDSEEEGSEQAEEGDHESDSTIAPETSDTAGWKEIDGNRYYYGADKQRASGWRKIGGAWYYFDGGDVSYPGRMLRDTVQNIEGKYYLFRSDGVMQTGWIERTEGWYYANADGSFALGWMKSGGKWYYLDGADLEHPGLMAENTKMLIGGKYYEFAANGVMLTGWIEKPEGWYYANADGAFAMGWVKSKNRWYYLDGGNTEHVGLMVESTRMLIGGKYYEFAANGVMQTGWIRKPEGWYYANTNGTFAMGWVKSKNRWYYLDGSNTEYTGLMAENTNMLINGKYYGFNADGAMLTGWIKRPEGWYYANSSGAFMTNWIKSGNKWYYLNPNDEEYPGRMLAGVSIEIDGLPYTFLPSGEMKTGWEKVDDAWYYYDALSGQTVSGWKKISGKWYYFDPDTKQMASAGWHEIEGTYYYMNANGDMATGWKKIDNNWYYLGSNGKMYVGWRVVDGFWYYFYTENDSHGGTYGVMASNTTIDGYRIQPNGMYLTAVQSRMYARAQGYSSSTGYLIMIDTTNCSLGVFTGMRGHWNMVKSWSCSPGAPATPTVKGVFSVGSKGYYFDSGNLRLYWYTQFYGDYLIHSVCYLHDGSPADLRTGLHLSHGCVRLEISNAKWVYDNVPRGSTVVAY